MAFHQPAAHQVRSDNFCGAAEEGVGQSGEILGDGLVGYRSGLGGVACVEWGAALDWVRKTKKGGSGFSAAKPTPT
ncbi:hypothetical protein, partial [Prochlorococcus sp. P1344]